DQEDVAGDEPGQVLGGGLGGLVGGLLAGGVGGNLAEVAGQPAVRKADDPDQHLLGQDRQRQADHDPPHGRRARPRDVVGLQDGGGGPGRVHGGAPAVTPHSRPSAPKRSPATSFLPGCVTTSPLTRTAPPRTSSLAWPPVSARPTTLTAWANVTCSP